MDLLAWICTGAGVVLAIAWMSYNEFRRAPAPSPPSPLPPPPRVPPLSVINEPGSITLIMGPMFSGKTRELFRRWDVRRIAGAVNGHKSVLIKWHQDTRYNTDVSVATSHAGLERKDALPASTLRECTPSITKDIKHIFIDEGQFFPDLTDQCIRWVHADRLVTISALTAFDTGDMWPQIQKLLPYCKEVVQLTAVCEECGRQDASLTVKRGGAAAAEIRVGGKELYKAICTRCYHPAQ